MAWCTEYSFLRFFVKTVNFLVRAVNMESNASALVSMK